MNELDKFDGFQSFNLGKQDLRTRDVDGKVWCVVTDICELIGDKRPARVVSSLKDSEKMLVDTKDSSLDFSRELFPAGNPNMWLISASAASKLILRSEHPDADKIFDWLTEEVIPSIRTTGSYRINPQAQIQAAQIAELKVKAYKELLNKVQYSRLPSTEERFSVHQTWRVITESGGRIYTAQAVSRKYSKCMQEWVYDNVGKCLYDQVFFTSSWKTTVEEIQKFNEETARRLKLGECRSIVEVPANDVFQWFLEVIEDQASKGMIPVISTDTRRMDTIGNYIENYVPAASLPELPITTTSFSALPEPAPAKHVIHEDYYNLTRTKKPKNKLPDYLTKGIDPDLVDYIVE